MKLLITGGCGFLGSNLSVAASKSGHRVLAIDNMNRSGCRKNKDWIESQCTAECIEGDVTNKNQMNMLFKNFVPDAIFHLAGQVAMTVSIDQPYDDFRINTLGTVNVLEAIRENCPDCKLLFSSTNKVYGDLEQYTYEEKPTRWVCLDYPNGFPESVPLNFQSPYGCSKGAADQYVIDYAKTFGLQTVVFRHSSIYGSRQFATEQQGWVGWFCQEALCQQNGTKNEITISGDGKQVRDLLYIDDLIALYLETLLNDMMTVGRAYNIGGSIDNSLSLIELFDILGEELGIKIKYKTKEKRLGDQRVFIADIRRIKKDLSWEPKINKFEGIKNMLKWINK